jgi:23S rRNA (cytidine2498-2'-O)-methyltransferase
MVDSGFIFVTCQIGAEEHVKAELACDWPALRFAYSRPGFLTLKVAGPASIDDRCLLGSVFARAAAFSLGKTTGTTAEERAQSAWQMATERHIDRLHVWQRDLVSPDHRGAIANQPSPLVVEIAQAIRHFAPQQGSVAASRLDDPARSGDMVLDCVVVEPGEWWIGWHRASGMASRRPGGLFFDPLPPDAVSRAYLKMEESLAWSGLPVVRGDWCVEIGSAPGGASQALLNRGLHVVGIDPADMDPRVLANPNFEHWKKRGADVRRREFRKMRWLTADMNVAPSYTLDTVEAIVTHRDVHIEGLLLTLKLMDGSPALEVPEYLERVQSWGYAQASARQLHHNRHDFCLAASRGQTPKRAGGRRKATSHRASHG